MIADLSREKLTLQRSQNSVLLYGCSCLSAINEASLLKTTVAVVQIQPKLRLLSAIQSQQVQKKSNSLWASAITTEDLYC